MSYFNENVFEIIPKEIKNFIKTDCCEYKINQEHSLITPRVINSIKEDENKSLQAIMIKAAYLREFLG
jgi:phosphoenolpyruvate carboxylase